MNDESVWPRNEMWTAINIARAWSATDHEAASLDPEPEYKRLMVEQLNRGPNGALTLSTGLAALLFASLYELAEATGKPVAEWLDAFEQMT